MSEKYWPQGGGAELATHLILNEVKDFFDITVVTGARYPARLEGVKYLYLPLLDTQPKIQLWVNILIERSYVRNLIDKFDIVYVPRLAYPVVDMAKRCGKKVVVHLHDYQPLSYEACVIYPYEETYRPSLIEDIKNSFRLELLKYNNVKRAVLSTILTPVNRLSRLWVSRADDVICVSSRQSDIIESAIPELADKLRVIYNPIQEVPIAEKRLGDSTIMYLGGDSYVKGFHIFLEASRRILKLNRDVKFLVAGGLSRKGISLIDTLRNEFNGAFQVFGYVNHDKVSNLYSESCALLFPSVIEEPCPYSVLEAMLSGVIPVASRVGGVPEMVEGTYAEKMLFTPGDVDELTDRTETVLSLSNEQFIEIGASLREGILSRFSYENIERDLIDVFT